jgi:hypothetical protein
MFTNKGTKKAVFLCTDGLNTCDPSGNSCKIVEEIYRRSKINFFILSLLQDQKSNYCENSIFDCIAEITDGKLFIMNGNNIAPQENRLPFYIYPLKLSDCLKVTDCLNKNYSKF